MGYYRWLEPVFYSLVSLAVQQVQSQFLDQYSVDLRPEGRLLSLILSNILSEAADKRE